MYKGPPPEVSSEQFYETDVARGFARGFSIQTVSPQPIGWAEHVLADGHWGRAMREYMRDYNHWTTIGVLNELLPHAENRVTLDDGDRPLRDAGGAVRLQPLRERQGQHGLLDRGHQGHPASRRRPGHPDDPALRPPGRRRPHGHSPENSVVNADHRVWAVPNLFIADGSVCPTQGAANPALTIMALASRLAERLASGDGELIVSRPWSTSTDQPAT